ncbi:MAG: LEA type 2 family protein [bacterium]
MRLRLLPTFAAVMVSAMALGGCESLRELGLSVERPTARVESVSLSDVTFSDLEVLTDISVENPNAVGVTLAGFSYVLDVEGSRFLSGDQREGLRIEPFGGSSVLLPLRIEYENVLAAYESVREQDEARFAINVDLQFELPVLGAITLPLRHEGTFPVVRPPVVRVAQLTLDSIRIDGARMSLTLELDNPNGFDLAFSDLSFAFSVQERVWVDGSFDRPRVVPANGSGSVTTEFGLSFSAFGRTVRDMLLGEEAIAYSFVASATVDPGLPIMPSVTVPFSREGAIDLRRR